MSRWTTAHDQRLRRLHAQGLMNRDLAWQLGVSEATIKRKKARLGLGSNCPANNLGAWGEQAFQQAALQRGLPARIVSEDGNPYDVDMAGLRVEVKTAGCADGQWHFKFAPERPSYHGEGSPTRKDYVRDCDVIVCVGTGGAASGSPFFYFLTPQKGLTYLPLSTQALISGALDNWWVLEAQLDRRAV